MEPEYDYYRFSLDTPEVWVSSDGKTWKELDGPHTGFTAELTTQKDTTMINQNFTATNGIKIEISTGGNLTGRSDLGALHATGGADRGVQALREYFTHERDTQLGRWRSKQHPNYVVYPIDGFPDVIDIVHEANNLTHRCARHCFHVDGSTRAAVKDEYYAAHPEPKPWENAKPGEAWVITMGSGTVPATVFSDPNLNENRFDTGDMQTNVTNPRITHATRIWPRSNDEN